MRQYFRSSAGFIVLIAVGLILAAAGTATAAKLITGADIKNGTIQGKDIKNGTIQSKDIKNGTIQDKDIKAGAITEKRLSQSVRTKLDAGGFLVNDGDGKPVSAVVAVEGDSFLRVVDGALWRFRWDGRFVPLTLFFTDNNCTGPAFLGVGSDGEPNPQRGVFGSNGQAYRFSNAAPQVRDFKSRLDQDGACSPSVLVTTLSKELQPVTAPAELKGPLTVQANP